MTVMTATFMRQPAKKEQQGGGLVTLPVVSDSDGHAMVTLLLWHDHVKRGDFVLLNIHVGQDKKSVVQETRVVQLGIVLILL